MIYIILIMYYLCNLHKKKKKKKIQNQKYSRDRIELYRILRLI